MAPPALRVRHTRKRPFTALLGSTVAQNLAKGSRSVYKATEIGEAKRKSQFRNEFQEGLP
jgi:hypothetical protein